MPQYSARQGDTIDYICWQYFGSETYHQMVVKTLELNPSIDKLVLDAGDLVELPEREEAVSVSAGVRLWE